MDCPFDKIHLSLLEKDDRFFMSLAYNQAVEAWKRDEVPVGAVAVLEGEVIGNAHNSVIQTGDPTAHAEILALSQAAAHLSDYRLNAVTLFVTKEPCPMCAGAVIMGRVGRVVFGMADPKMGFLGTAADVRATATLNHKPLVLGGVLQNECHEIMRAFFERKRRRAGGESI